MTPTCGRNGGFTLLELLFSIAIAAILMLVAAPSFITFQRNSELTAAANSMLGSVGAARTEAMKRNLPALIAPTGTGWASGWRVFVDVDRNGSYGSGDILVNTQDALKPYFSVAGINTSSGAALSYIRFDGSGYAKTSSTLAFARTDVTGTAIYAQTRYLILALTGRARVCKPSGASDATCGSALTN